MIARASPQSDRWRAFTAAFSGWMLDGYDFTILTFVLIDIQRDLSVGAAAAGALGTVTLLTRLIGGVIAGQAADRWGRRQPLLISIVWFSACAFLSGFSHSYATLFALRALFGLGMGGEWAVGMTLVLEHWPDRPGFVLGVLQGAFSWGFIVAALVFDVVYPWFGTGSPWGWRVLVWIGVIPAAFVFWTRSVVPESPVWLSGQGVSTRGRPPGFAILLGLRWDIARTTVVLGALMFSYQAMSFWYASLLRQSGRAPLAYLVALNAGGIIGAALWGAAGDSRLGRRCAIAVASCAAVAVLPLFLYAQTTTGLWLGAAFTGFTGAGILGVAPTYVGNQLPTAVRGTGAGVIYHTAAVLGAVAQFLLGVMQDTAWPLREAMALFIVTASLLAAIAVWSGPDTRERVVSEFKSAS